MTKEIIGKSGFPDHDPRSKIDGDDAKIVDDKGLAVVRGKPWSTTGTSVFLTIVRAPKGTRYSSHSTEKGGGIDHGIIVMVSYGRPKFDRDVFGGTLELPDDLGDDPLKRQYVGEWIGGTMAEIFVEFELPKDDAVWLLPKAMFTAEQAIKDWGF